MSKDAFDQEWWPDDVGRLYWTLETSDPPPLTRSARFIGMTETSSTSDGTAPAPQPAKQDSWAIREARRVAHEFTSVNRARLVQELESGLVTVGDIVAAFGKVLRSDHGASLTTAVPAEESSGANDPDAQ
jgi:hypothetical protein